MSKNKNRIIKTLAKYDLLADEINYQLLGVDFEMCGRSGGWIVITNKNDTYMAYNIDELINKIETDKGNYKDQELIQKYCNHIGAWIDGNDHSKGITCAKCNIFLGCE